MRDLAELLADNQGNVSVSHLAAPVMHCIEIPAGAGLARNEQVVRVQAGPIGAVMGDHVVLAQRAVEKRIDFAVRSYYIAGTSRFTQLSVSVGCWM